MSALARSLFVAYSLNTGNRPDDHYNRSAAEQWMQMALDECGVTEVLAAARASLDARDLVDQMAADDRLRAALAACEPTDTDHNREAVDGLCVEETNDEQ